MKVLWDILRIWSLCVFFVGAVCSVLIGIFFVIGPKVEGYTLLQNTGFALRDGYTLGAGLGTLLTLTILWQNWRVARHNRRRGTQASKDDS